MQGYPLPETILASFQCQTPWYEVLGLSPHAGLPGKLAATALSFHLPRPTRSRQADADLDRASISGVADASLLLGIGSVHEYGTIVE